MNRKYPHGVIYPSIQTKTHSCDNPHVVVLGAGFSLAALANGDKNGKKLPLMNNLWKTLAFDKEYPNLNSWAEGKNFEDIFQELKITHPDIASQLEDRIYTYFDSLHLPDEPTLYDALVLSYREKDAIATFNWDPFLIQAIRRNLHTHRQPQVFCLHGNVAVGACVACRVKGLVSQSCNKCGKPLSRSRLLYPVKEKGYKNDPFISSEWDGVLKYLEMAFMVTVIGYSAPKSDFEAISLMKKAWKKNASNELALFQIVDIKKEAEVKRSWKSFSTNFEFGYSNSIFDSWTGMHPRRSCDAYVMASMQQAPEPEYRLQGLPSTLEELRSFFQPLIDSEEVSERKGVPLIFNPNRQRNI